MINLNDSSLQQRLQALESEIKAACNAANRDRSKVKLVGVSKKFALTRIQDAVAAGIKHVGESYAQEAEQKWADPNFPAAFRHFIGPLQSNKLRIIARYADYLHSLENTKHAKRLARMLSEIGRAPLPVLVQVNITGEQSKHGVTADRLAPLLDTIDALPELKLCGLMTIGRLGASDADNQTDFTALAKLRDNHRAQHPSLEELSMGMSGDFTAAIHAGATMIRVGTRIFGQRTT